MRDRDLSITHVSGECGGDTWVIHDEMPEWIERIQARREFTWDCPHCDTEVITQYVDDERILIARNMHEVFHEQSNGEWPLDGQGTGYIDISMDAEGNISVGPAMISPAELNESQRADYFFLRREEIHEASIEENREP